MPTPTLVTDEEVYQYLDITAGIDDPNGSALAIRDACEALLAAQTGQIFGVSAVFTNEKYDGTGTDTLWLKRPLTTLSAITFVNPFDSDDTVELDLVGMVSWSAGSRRVVLRSMRFTRGRDNVLVTYTSQANAPALAKQAVREAVATIFRRIGSEDARSEQIGTFQHVLLRKLEESMTWQKAVDLLAVPSLG
jgi:hypothetical protein